MIPYAYAFILYNFYEISRVKFIPLLINPVTYLKRASKLKDFSDLLVGDC